MNTMPARTTIAQANTMPARTTIAQAAPTHCSDCRRPFSDTVRMYWIPGRPKQMCYQCARDYAGADDDDRPSRRDED